MTTFAQPIKDYLADVTESIGVRYLRHIDEVQAADEEKTYSDGTCVYSHDRTRLIRCEKPVETYRVPKGTRVIGPYAFEYQRQLKSVVLPEGLEEIGDGAFMACNSLVKADFPDSLKSIGDEAFFCTLLKHVRIPAGLVHMGRSPFLYMPRHGKRGALLPQRCSVEVDPGNARFSVTDGFLLETLDDGTRLAIWYFGPGGEVCVPDGVRLVGDFAVSCGVSARVLSLPASLRKIGVNGLSVHNNPEVLRLGLPDGGSVELRPSPDCDKTRTYHRMFSKGDMDVELLVGEYDAGLKAMKRGLERTRRMVARIEDGRLLDNDVRRDYMATLKADVESTVEDCARTDDTETIKSLCALRVIDRRNVQRLIDIANAAGGVLACRQLMEESQGMSGGLGLDL